MTAALEIEELRGVAIAAGEAEDDVFELGEVDVPVRRVLGVDAQDPFRDADGPVGEAGVVELGQRAATGGSVAGGGEGGGEDGAAGVVHVEAQLHEAVRDGWTGPVAARGDHAALDEINLRHLLAAETALRRQIGGHAGDVTAACRVFCEQEQPGVGGHQEFEPNKSTGTCQRAVAHQ
jgi:hypothetical protein